MKKYILALTTTLFLASISIAHATPLNSYSAYGSFGFESYELTDDLDRGGKYHQDGQMIRIDGFDSSYGTLAGVNINYESRWSQGAGVKVADNHDLKDAREWTQGFVFAASSLTVDLYDPSGDRDSHISLLIGGCSGSGANSAECGTEYTTRGSFDGDLNHQLPSLDYFIDSYLTIGVVRELWVQAFSWDNNSAVIASNTNNEWEGRITVTYTYDEKQNAPVPEPATMLLFGSGLMGLISLRRKKISYRD
jgi:hypothetical protein